MFSGTLTDNQQTSTTNLAEELCGPPTSSLSQVYNDSDGDNVELAIVTSEMIL